MEEQGADKGGDHTGKAPRAGHRVAGGVEQLRAGGTRRLIPAHRFQQRFRRSGKELGVLVEQEAELSAGPLEEQRVVLGLAGANLALDQLQIHVEGAHRAGGSVVGCVVEDEHLALDTGGMVVLNRDQAAQQEVAPVRVHDA